MLRLSKEADYALVLLCLIAADPGQQVRSARELAERTELPRPIVGKVLKALARAGVLVSQRGVQGGYRLARDPSQLLVRDVIEALEGPLAVTWCGAEDLRRRCERELTCPSRGPVARLTGVVREALADVRLADLIAPGETSSIAPGETSPGKTSALTA